MFNNSRLNYFFILFHFGYFVYAGDPNMDLVLANSGMHLGVDTSLDKRIMTQKPNYNSVFGKDPEMERNARSMKEHLSSYKKINSPTMEEWISIKNLAVSAVRGECKAADKLFESHVIPRGEYDKLLKRCGRTGIEHGINNDLQALRIREKAGDSYAHANLDHLRQHHASGESQYTGMGDALNESHNHQFGDAGNNMNTGMGLNYGITAGDSTKGALDTLFDEPTIKRGAFAVLGRDFESLKGKLDANCTPFGHDAIDRLNRLKHVAEDVIHEVGGAAEKFAELQHDNRRYTEAMLGHGGIDEELRNALATGEIDEQIHAVSVPLHGQEPHGEAHMEAQRAAMLHDDLHGALDYQNARADRREHAMQEQNMQRLINAENGLDAAANAENAHSAQAQADMVHDAAHKARIDNDMAIDEHNKMVHDIAADAGFIHDAGAMAKISNDLEAHRIEHARGELIAHAEENLAAEAAVRLEAQRREIEAETAGRIDDFARKTYDVAMDTGAPESDAIGYAKQARALAAEFENNMASGLNKSEAMDKAITATNNLTGKVIPEKITNAFYKMYAQPYNEDQKAIEMLAKSNNAAFAASPIIQQNVNSIAAGSLSDALKFNRAAEEIAARKHVAEAKIVEAEVKMHAANERIKEANLATDTKLHVDIIRQSLEDQEKGEIPLNRKQVEVLNDKKKRYETVLANNQPKSIRNASNLKDLTDLDKQYNEILAGNKKIVEQENLVKEEAKKRHINIVTPKPDMAMEEINSRHELSTAKKNARMVEESLAREAEEKEIQEAREIASRNVKRLGGGDEEAAKEGEKASVVKRKMIEGEKMDMAKKIQGKLRNQVGDLKAIQEAQHIAMTHNGKNPMGNSVTEIEDHQKNIVMNEEDEEFRKKQPAEDRNLVIKIMPDNASQISADNSVIELPLNGVPSAKAKTIEEENIKKELENLRDDIRNKVTLKNFNSGLVVVKGIEGYMNLPESCKEITIKKGIIYYDQAGYNFMVSQKLDVTPLTAIYSRGNEPVYYKVEFKDMKMKLPSILNTNPQKLLYNEFETINIEFAKRLEVVNGVVDCESWSSFSSRMRPKVYKGISKGADEVPDSVKMEFERIESDKDGLKSSDVKIVKNPDGMIMAEIKPQFGISTKMKIGDAVRRAKEIGAKKHSKPSTNLNVAEEPREDYTKEFLKSVEEDLVGKKEYIKVLNENNPIVAMVSQQSGDKPSDGSSSSRTRNGSIMSPGSPRVENSKTSSSISSRIQNMKTSPSLEEQKQLTKRTGNDEESKSFNKLIDNTENAAGILKMSEKDFIDSISKVDNATISKMLEYFFEVSNSPDYQKKLSQMDQQEFSVSIKQYFPKQAMSDVVRVFFKSFSEVVRIPNKIDGQPITNLTQVNHGPCCNVKTRKCYNDCVTVKEDVIGELLTNKNSTFKANTATSPSNIVVVQPSANPKTNYNNAKLKTLNFCKSLNETGCIVLGKPSPNGSPFYSVHTLTKPKLGSPNVGYFLNANNSGKPVLIKRQQLNTRPNQATIKQTPDRPGSLSLQPAIAPGTGMPIQPDNPNARRPRNNRPGMPTSMSKR